MEIQKRVQDIDKVFDQKWQANHQYQQVKDFNAAKKKHFNKMYSIQDKEERKKEILEANSVQGRVSRLEQNMKAASGNELLRNRNRFR